MTAKRAGRQMRPNTIKATNGLISMAHSKLLTAPILGLFYLSSQTRVPMSQGPGNLPLLDYAINIGVAIVGASVRFAREWQVNYADWDRKRILIEAFINVTTAGFVGLLTFWVLTSWKIDPLYTAFAVGIMGHAGPEGIALLKESLFNAIRTKAPPEK